MARAKRSGFRRTPGPHAAVSETRQAKIDDALRAIVRALARQAARDVFGRESQLDPDRETPKDTP